MSNTNRPKVVLVIADGWGIGAKDASNPLRAAKTPNISFIRDNFLSGALQASGLAVGLPWNEEGNSEIGHLTIGAGRIVYQSAARIGSAITDGSFFTNPQILYAFQKAKESGGSVNLIGLLGSGITHSAFKHLESLISIADKEKIPYKLHLFTDGRDSPTKTAKELIKNLREDRIGSIGGRFYGMDRDNHPDRTEKAFQAILGKIPVKFSSPSAYVAWNYEKDITDETIPPASFNPENLSLKENDSVIFFNFRADRMRQIARKIFEHFPETPKISFTQYDESIAIPFAFTFEEIKNPLPAVIANRGLSQLHIAESEKSAHVTYFLNAENETIFPGEFRIIIPSKRVASHDKHPEMMAPEITSRVVTAIEENLYDFIVVNYANTDMVAHTGNFDATVKAAEIVDAGIGEIKSAVLRTDGIMVFTSDHGNAEKLIDTMTGERDTRHNSGPVPLYIVGNKYRRPKTEAEADENERLVVGSLCDVAPTILELMGIPKEADMTGQSLIPFLS